MEEVFSVSEGNPLLKNMRQVELLQGNLRQGGIK